MDQRSLSSIRKAGKEAILRRYPPLFWWYVYMRHGHLEPEMALLPALCRREATSVDVGANYGIYSHYLSKLSTKCVAFEPYPHLAEILRSGLKGRVRIESVALSNRSGQTAMLAAPNETGLNTIEPTNRISAKAKDPSSLTTLAVPVSRLDDFQLEQVGFLKIDVEGHEEEVIEGGEETIRRYVPAILIEIEERHRSGARDRISNRLSSFGYEGFFLHQEALHPLNSFDPDRLQNIERPDDYIRNFIFLPRSRMGEYAASLPFR